MYTAGDFTGLPTATVLIAFVAQVKCTGEKDGCRRCIENNARCSYSATVNSRSLSNANTQENSRSEAPPTVRSTSTSSPEYLVTRLTPALIGDAGSEMTADRPNMSEDHSMINVNTDYYTGLTPDIDMDLEDIRQSSPLPHGPFADFGADFSILDTTEPICPSLFAETSSSEEFDAASARRQRFSCSEMVRTYEMAELYLVWAPRDRSGVTSIEVDEILRYQKKVLASCEAVLSCTSCSLQSEQVLLMISICNKLLASFVQMSAAPPSVAQERPRPSKSAQRSSRQQQQLFKECSGTMSRGLNSVISEWKIDDDDKKQVLKALLNARAARLNGLMDRLGEVVTANHWVIHKSMVRDLLERFAEHQALWKQ